MGKTQINDCKSNAQGNDLLKQTNVWRQYRNHGLQEHKGLILYFIKEVASYFKGNIGRFAFLPKPAFLL